MADDQLNTNLERILTGLRSQLDGSLRKAAEEIVRALAAERDRAVSTATAEVRRQAQEQLAHLREAAKKQNDDVRASAEGQVAELRRMLEELKRNAQQQIETARKTLETEVAAARSKASADVEEARRAAQGRVEELQRSTDERVARMERDLAAARTELAAARTEVEAERERTEAERQRTEEARQAAVASTAEVNELADVVDAMRSLDESRSLLDVFTRLLEYSGRFAERSAVLLVKGERLEAWRAEGLQIDVVTMPVNEAGLAGAAVREHRAMTRRAGEGPQLPAFATGAERDAAAIPISVAGVVVAVLYADVSPAAASADAAWTASLEVVARHASRVLETTTVQEAAGMLAADSMARPSHPWPGHP